MKNRILILFLLLFGLSSAQEKQSELIIGTWRFYETCDFRTDSEKNEFVAVDYDSFETGNKTRQPDRTFKENGEYQDYYTKDNIEYGKWKIKNKKLLLTRRISKETEESSKERIQYFSRKEAISLDDDGFYYFRPIELDIKSLAENLLQLGSEKIYSIHKRVK